MFLGALWKRNFFSCGPCHACSACWSETHRSCQEMEKEISEWISSALDDPYDRGSKHGLMFPVHKELVRQTFTICETAVPDSRKDRTTLPACLLVSAEENGRHFYLNEHAFRRLWWTTTHCILFKLRELMVIKCLDVTGPQVVIIDTSNWHMRRTKENITSPQQHVIYETQEAAFSSLCL
ncbi:hypothetical protein M513_04689 [Trichuris suis]|uniref:Uncharacterized protein n=1 Tax=Trichuris suis TaxID=68888 RepID=A0A085MAV0_9BILA|nr:hypothetical protein M513_04689 [Trichuris suis]